MTENEAIKELNYDDTAYGGKATKAVREIAIQALTEIQQYRATGLPPEKIYEIAQAYQELSREVAELRKKQEPQKPVYVENDGIRYTGTYRCPGCGGNFSGTGIAEYCYHCGQALDWSGTGCLDAAAEPYREKV